MDGIKLFGYSSDTGEFDSRYLKRPKKEQRAYCCYCRVLLNINTRTKDHLHPKSLGGRTTKPCCSSCNKEKGCMTLPIYILYLRDQQQVLDSKTDEWRKRETQIRNAEKIWNKYFKSN